MQAKLIDSTPDVSKPDVLDDKKNNLMAKSAVVRQSHESDDAPNFGDT